MASVWRRAPCAENRHIHPLVQNVDDEPVASVKVEEQLASQTAELSHDILIFEILVPVQETTHLRRVSLKMRKNGRINERILWGKSVPVPVSGRGCQNRRVEWNRFSRTQESRTYVPETPAVIFSALDQKIRKLPKPAELFCVNCSPGHLIEFRINLSPYFPAPLLPLGQGPVRLSQTIGRYDKINTTRLAKFQYFFTTLPLLLQQGQFKNEVGLDVDVHATASYSIRPSLTAL